MNKQQEAALLRQVKDACTVSVEREQELEARVERLERALSEIAHTLVFGDDDEVQWLMRGAITREVMKAAEVGE